jgi:hypothetical protein
MSFDGKKNLSQPGGTWHCKNMLTNTTSKKVADRTWVFYVRNGLICLMVSMAAYCIYADGFFRYTWLSHACLAAMMWVVLGNEGSLQEKLHTKSPQMWVAIVAMAGIVADLFLVKR